MEDAWIAVAPAARGIKNAAGVDGVAKVLKNIIRLRGSYSYAVDPL